MLSLTVELEHHYTAGWQCHVTFWKKKMSEFGSLQFNFLFLLVICKCTHLSSPSKTYAHICQKVLVPFGQVPTSVFLAEFWLKFRYLHSKLKGKLQCVNPYVPQKRKKGGGRGEKFVTTIWHSSSHYLLLISSNLCVAACFLSSLEVKLVSVGECVNIWDQKASRQSCWRAKALSLGLEGSQFKCGYGDWNCFVCILLPSLLI